jgi:hypothetical protein
MRSRNHGIGFRWPVSVERVIEAPAQEVWDAISRPGNLEYCHPFCASNPVQVWPGPESQDEVHYLSGWIFERRFREWIEGIGYDLEIGRKDGGTSSVSWRITPIDNHSCRLRIKVSPHALQNIPVVLRWLPHIFWLRPLLRKYLDSVVRGVGWFAIRHEPVPRNAFGRHPWFSARKSTPS